MAEEEGRHCLDLDIREPSWKCLSRLCVQADSFGWTTGVRHKEINLQRLARIDAILIEVVDALGRQKAVVDQKVPGKALGLLKNAVGGLGNDLRLSRPAHHRIAAEKILDRRRGDGRSRP